MRRPNKQAPNSRKRGPSRECNEPKVTMGTTTASRRLREDMWAYELIVSGVYPPHSCSCADSSYYLNARWLLQELYLNCYQAWARCLSAEGYLLDNPSSFSYERPQNTFVNVPTFQPNHYEPESKNLLLLSAVADFKQRQRLSQTKTDLQISDEFHLGQSTSPKWDAVSGSGMNFMGNETTYDSKDMVFSNAIFIKTEENESSFENM